MMEKSSLLYFFIKKSLFSKQILGILFGVFIHCQLYANQNNVQQIPSPAELDVDIIVNANVSTLKKVEIFFSDQIIPRNYAGNKIANVNGFRWWASKHFALQTDHNEAQARKALELLEMAYPHWVDYMNNEPEDMHNTRIPIVYASDWNKIKETTKEYGLLRSPVKNGEMMFYNSVAYAHDGNTLYLLLHEGFHAFADCFRNGLKTGWFVEGAAQDSASYVINDDWTQLAVFVFDRGPRSIVRRSLERWKSEPPAVTGFTAWGPPYNQGATIQHFLKDDPLRNQYWKIWSMELSTESFKLKDNQHQANQYSDQLLYSFFGSKEQFKQAWEGWLNSIELSMLTFGKWKREGNAVWNTKKKGYLRFNLPPGSTPSFNATVMDYFPPKLSPLIGKVARGVKEPSIGVLMEISGQGKSGIGLGESGGNMFKIMIDGYQSLIFNGKKLNAGTKTVALPAELRSFLKEHKDALLGITVGLKNKELNVRLAYDSESPKEFLYTYLVSTKLMQRIKENAIALVAEDGSKNKLIPYFDDGRPAAEEYLQAASANRWRNPGDSAFGWVVEASWRLGKDAPKSLLALRDSMHVAAAMDKSTQLKALEEFEKNTPKMANKIAEIKSNTASQALLALSGSRIFSSWVNEDDSSVVNIVAVIDNPGAFPMQGKIQFTVDDATAVENLKEQQEIFVKEDSQIRVVAQFKRKKGINRPFNIIIQSELEWCGQTIVLNDKITDTRWPGLTMDVAPILENKNDEAIVKLLLHSDDIYPISGEIRLEAIPNDAVETPVLVFKTDLPASERKQIYKKFKLAKVVKPFSVRVIGDFMIDNEELQFKSEVGWPGNINN